jgi:hypothetical protein
MGKADIARGEKWTRIRASYVFQKRDKDVDWIDSQEAIVDDMKEYSDSIKPVKETKSKGEK